jgi:hypothetical protein
LECLAVTEVLKVRFHDAAVLLASPQGGTQLKGVTHRYVGSGESFARKLRNLSKRRDTRVSRLRNTWIA